MIHCLLFLALSLLPAPAQVAADPITIQQDGPHNTTTLRVAGEQGHYIGFDVLADGMPVVPVRFTSGEQITCPTVKVTHVGNRSSLLFDGLQGTPECGLKLERSRIEVTLTAQRYPVVTFDLHIASFAPERWQEALGRQPFHFLTLGMPDALVWHHRGWLNATPRADPFPLLLDTHIGTPEISAYPYNREWSTTPPLSAHPLPVIGLWSPARKLYAAWDFQEARLTDNSERDIATGFCNRLIAPVVPGRRQPPEELMPPFDVTALGGRGLEEDRRAPPLSLHTQSWLEVDSAGLSKFVALVYPYGGTGYQQCVYPQAGAHITSHATLDYSLDLKPTDDPNRFLWQTWWEDDALRARLPRVPASVDLSWIGDEGHLKTLPGAPGGSLLTGVEGHFQTPNARLIDGWGWHNESAVAAPVRLGERARLQALEREADILERYARRFTVDKAPCVYWEKPLVGMWTPEWGGAPVTTLHNANGWAAGRLLLDLYRYDGKKNYLPLVEGVYNWTRHIVWTRNEFADVPSSPFAIGSTLATAFLLDYYFAFKDDADHRTRALEALDLAHSFTYRTLVMWTADSDRHDNLDSAFLWEPNSGRDWTGAACANEVIWNLDTLAQVAVHTGDPILLWALQGSLSRWHLLYQNVYHDRLADYRPDDFTEGYGLAPGNVYGGPGHRAAYGFGGPLAMLEPVGETTVRVLAGEKAALAFDRDGVHTRLSDYRCSGDGDFAFTVRSTRPAVDISVTFPGVDLTKRPVFLRRNGVIRIPLQPGDRVLRDPHALWSLIVKGVQAGDTVIVGDADLTSDRLPCLPPLLSDRGFQGGGPGPAVSTAPFLPIELPEGAVLDTDWHHDGFAGLTAGLHTIHSIPFLLSVPQVLGRSGIIRLPAPVPAVRALYLLYAPARAIPDAAPDLPTAQSSPHDAADPANRRTPQVASRPPLEGKGGNPIQNPKSKIQNPAPLPALLLDDGTRALPASGEEALAWRAWPPVQTERLLTMAYRVPSGRTVIGIDAGLHTVVAATALSAGPEADAMAAEVEANLTQGREEYRLLRASERQIVVLRALSARLPEGRVALLPPFRAGSPVAEPLVRGGFRRQMAVLSPEQVADPSQFNAARFPVAVYVGGEEYTDTARTPGDIAAALIRYVHEGGTLMLLSDQPYPLYYGLGPGGRRVEDPLPPRLGLPLLNAIETAPDNDVLRVFLTTGQKALPGAPPDFRYPEGDPRLRAVDRSRLPAGAVYTPLYQVRGAFGKEYGDAAVLLELPAQGGTHRGRILYIANVLLRAPDAGPRLIAAALRWMIDTLP